MASGCRTWLVCAHSQDGVGSNRCRSCAALTAGRATLSTSARRMTIAQLAVLKAATRQRMASAQLESDSGLEARETGGPLAITSSRTGQLWDALSRAYRVLGSTQRTVVTKCSRRWCWLGSSSVQQAGLVASYRGGRPRPAVVRHPQSAGCLCLLRIPGDEDLPRHAPRMHGWGQQALSYMTCPPLYSRSMKGRVPRADSRREWRLDRK